MDSDRRKPYKGAFERNGSKRREPGYRPNKRGLNSKIHLAVDKRGLPVRVKITAGNVNDNVEAIEVLDGLPINKLLADKGYDTDAIIDFAKNNEIEAVIPPKSNRKKQRYYDKQLYRMRHIVENAFLWFKRWRGIATRYCKNSRSFLASVQIRCLFLHLKFIISKSHTDTI